MSALEFNQSQKHSPATIIQIQQTVGANPDGKWGKRTVVCVQAWQASNGMVSDGKVGPNTLAAFQKLWAQVHQHEPEELEADDAGDEPDEGEVGSTPAFDDEEGFHYFERPDDLAVHAKGPAVTALQNDLFAFGFEPGVPKSEFDKTTLAAVTAFQSACTTPHRIKAYMRVSHPENAATIATTGVVDAPTRAEIRRWKAEGWRWQHPESDYEERRIRVAKLGTLPRNSALLREVPGTGGKPRMLHRLAALDLDELIRACMTAIGVELRIQSGWRPHKWTSLAQYEATVTARFGSLAKGRKLLAFDSAHETGLAVDFGTGGLEASAKTIEKQRATPVYEWLVANAYRFGFTPYKAEPWHWEHPLSVRAWATGLPDWRLTNDD